MPLEDDFLYPLGLVLIGALITGFLIPRALSKLESTQRKIEKEEIMLRKDNSTGKSNKNYQF